MLLKMCVRFSPRHSWWKIPWKLWHLFARMQHACPGVFSLRLMLRCWKERFPLALQSRESSPFHLREALWHMVLLSGNCSDNTKLISHNYSLLAVQLRRWTNLPGGITSESDLLSSSLSLQSPLLPFCLWALDRCYSCSHLRTWT